QVRKAALRPIVELFIGREEGDRVVAKFRDARVHSAHGRFKRQKIRPRVALLAGDDESKIRLFLRFQFYFEPEFGLGDLFRSRRKTEASGAYHIIEAPVRQEDGAVLLSLSQWDAAFFSRGAAHFENVGEIGMKLKRKGSRN